MTTFTITTVITTFFINVIISIVILAVGNELIKFLMKYLNNSIIFKKVDTGVKTFLISFIKFGLKALLYYTILTILGFPTTSLIALIGSVGLAIGLSLQGSLTNIAGGLMILIFKPFKVGDVIEYNGSVASVSAITLLYTTLITGDNIKVVAPNGGLSNSVVKDYSNEKLRRVDVKFNVAYGVKLDDVKNAILEAVKKHEKVDLDSPITCRMINQKDSSLEFELRVWTLNANYFDVLLDLNELTYNVLLDNNFEIPFPQVDVHIKNQ